MDGYLGQLLLVPYTFTPKGWAFCDGSQLSVNEYRSLFILIGTTYGGDGVNTFALPDLRGRTPIGYGSISATSGYLLGQTGGQETVTLDVNNLPAHTHAVNVAGLTGDSQHPAGGLLGDGQNIYLDTLPPNDSLAGTACSTAGQNQAHGNLAPYLVLNWMIALEGALPESN